MKPCLKVSLQMPESTWIFDTPSSQVTSRSPYHTLQDFSVIFLIPLLSFFPPSAWQVFDTQGCWVFFFCFSFPSPPILPALSSSSPLPKRLQENTAAEVVWFKGTEPRWERLEIYALKFVRILCTPSALSTPGKRGVFRTAAQLGCVPRTEQGAKLEFFKRSFTGWWSVPAEGIKLSQVLKLLLGD